MAKKGAMTGKLTGKRCDQLVEEADVEMERVLLEGDEDAREESQLLHRMHRQAAPWPCPRHEAGTITMIGIENTPRCAAQSLG